jgi:hypothetical protein
MDHGGKADAVPAAGWSRGLFLGALTDLLLMYKDW